MHKYGQMLYLYRTDDQIQDVMSTRNARHKFGVLFGSGLLPSSVVEEQVVASSEKFLRRCLHLLMERESRPERV